MRAMRVFRKPLAPRAFERYTAIMPTQILDKSAQKITLPSLSGAQCRPAAANRRCGISTSKIVYWTKQPNGGMYGRS
jgi:hypothetical protein